MLDKEILVDMLREKFSEEVTIIIENCQFSGKNYVDVEGLNSRLKKLKAFSFNNSLSEDDWFELIYEFAPDVYDELSYRSIAA
ncbi:MAG: hypothetical protein HON90_15855 [Halobacteriovoraceae bacterium]|nr:hypothetical protein [Halobacteriovoraceae bacterium]